MGDCALRPDDDNGAGEGDGEVEGEGEGDDEGGGGEDLLLLAWQLSCVFAH